MKKAIRPLVAAMITGAVGAAAISGFSATASAQPMATAPGPMSGPMQPAMMQPQSEADFVRMIAEANTAEIGAARYVLQNTKNPVVMRFAQKMIDDHTSAQVSLEAASRGAGVAYVPVKAVPPGARREMAMLRSEQDPQLANDYVNGQVMDHRQAEAVLNWEIKNGTSQSLKDFASKTFPTVDSHLRMALAYQQSKGANMDLQVGGMTPGSTNVGGQPPNGTPANNPAVGGNGSTSGNNNPTGVNPSQSTPANRQNTGPAQGMPSSPGAGGILPSPGPATNQSTPPTSGAPAPSPTP